MKWPGVGPGRRGNTPAGWPAAPCGGGLLDDLIESLANGNPTAVKVVLASVVVALAAYQVFLMAVGYGKLQLPFLKPKPASFTHRAVGDAIAVLVAVVATMCVGYFGFEDAAGDEVRAAFHVLFAILLLVTLSFKIAVVRRLHHLGGFLPTLGITVFVLLVLTWLTSAGDYLAQ